MLDLLKKHFGYDQFRPLQKEVIDCCVSGRDALVLMPTGGGKSLCFQLPALKFPGITVVISPLIALMKDQVDALKANGIPAAFMNSSLSQGEMARVEQMALREELKLLYLAPERLAMPSVQQFLKSLRVSLFAIDEAHCISEWGHDFRPDYRNLSSLRRMFPETPIIALTATANARVRTDIVKQLGLEHGRIFQSSFNRPNLTYRVEPKKKSFDCLLAEVRDRPGQSVIVYCFSRKSTEKVAADLRANGVSAAAYHAGLTPQERTRVQEQFIRDQVPVIAATIAFGMGIDKPDVRLVVHMDIPKSVEGYYQETGRAGRDGLPSDCILYYSAGDRFKQEYFIREIPDPKEQLRARLQLQDITNYCEQKTCRRAFLLRFFGESWNETSCGGCDICLPPREQRKPLKDLTPVDFDRDLFDILRAKRREIAEEQGVPPYVVFGDKSLQEMARVYPQRLETLSRVFGVGKEKLAHYGETFLREIREYATAHNIAEKEVAPKETSVRAPKAPKEKVKRAISETIEATILLLKEGRKVGEIAQMRNLAMGTILQHIEQANDLNLKLETSHLTFPSQERYHTIAAALTATGGELLAPARAKLGEDYSYDEIRYVRLLEKLRRRSQATDTNQRASDPDTDDQPF